MAAATLPAIYWLARQLYDRRVALIAAALFTFNAYNVRYSQEARTYTLFLLLATLSSGFLIAFVRDPVPRNRRGYVIFSVLAVYAHFYALLLLLVHVLALRWLQRNQGGTDQSANEQRRTGLTMQLRHAWIAIGVAVLPLLVFVAKTGAGPIRWIQRPGVRDIAQFYEYLAGSNHWPLAAVCSMACASAVVPLGKKLWTRSQDPELWRVQFLLLWLFFPVALTALLSFARPVFLSRYMIFCLPPLLILVAAGLVRLRRLWMLALALAAILLLSLQGVFFVYGHDLDDERDAAGEATNFILDHTQPGDALVLHIAGTRVPYEFFRSLRAGEDTANPKFSAQLGPEILFPSHGAGLDYRDFTGKPTADLLRAAAPNHSRVWVVLMNNGPAGKPDPTTVMLMQTLPESFPKVLHWHFTRVEVLLYWKQ
jgi:mannosyltransferase